jgi:hypothetical protein
MSEIPVELDKHRGMAAQKATDIRRAIVDVELNAKLLREHQAAVELQLLTVPATSSSEAIAKARYVLNLYVPPASRRTTGITATLSPRCLPTLPASPAKAENEERSTWDQFESLNPVCSMQHRTSQLKAPYAKSLA